MASLKGSKECDDTQATKNIASRSLCKAYFVLFVALLINFTMTAGQLTCNPRIAEQMDNSTELMFPLQQESFKTRLSCGWPPDTIQSSIGKYGYSPPSSPVPSKYWDINCPQLERPMSQLVQATNMYLHLDIQVCPLVKSPSLHHLGSCNKTVPVGHKEVTESSVSEKLALRKTSSYLKYLLALVLVILCLVQSLMIYFIWYSLVQHIHVGLVKGTVLALVLALFSALGLYLALVPVLALVSAPNLLSIAFLNLTLVLVFIIRYSTRKGPFRILLCIVVLFMMAAYISSCPGLVSTYATNNSLPNNISAIKQTPPVNGNNDMGTNAGKRKSFKCCHEGRKHLESFHTWRKKSCKPFQYKTEQSFPTPHVNGSNDMGTNTERKKSSESFHARTKESSKSFQSKESHVSSTEKEEVVPAQSAAVLEQLQFAPSKPGQSAFKTVYVDHSREYCQSSENLVQQCTKWNTPPQHPAEVASMRTSPKDLVQQPITWDTSEVVCVHSFPGGSSSISIDCNTNVKEENSNSKLEPGSEKNDDNKVWTTPTAFSDDSERTDVVGLQKPYLFHPAVELKGRMQDKCENITAMEQYSQPSLFYQLQEVNEEPTCLHTRNQDSQLQEVNEEPTCLHTRNQDSQLQEVDEELAWLHNRNQGSQPLQEHQKVTGSINIVPGSLPTLGDVHIAY